MIIQIISLIIFILLIRFTFYYLKLYNRKKTEDYPIELQDNIHKGLVVKALYLIIPFRYMPYLIPYKMKWYFKNNNNNNISITIDDFPSKVNDNYKLLDKLDELNMKVTFMVIGGWVNNSDILLEAVNRGHTLGNHLKEDANYYNSYDDADFMKDLDYTQELIDDAYEKAGKKQKYKYYRTPRGPVGFNYSRVKLIEERDYYHIMGDIYSNDFDFVNDIDYHINYINNYSVGGSIVILHASNRVNVFNNTLNILEHIDKKFNIVTLDDLIT